jgi:uncharacterized linocin/CFP29 family protein
MPNDPQVPWTDEQWARVNQVIQKEASRARVAASFLPLSGPLPSDTDFVRAEIIPENIPAGTPLDIQDRDTIQLATLQVRVRVRSAQMADPELASALALFRRAANVIARLEDAVVFRGLVGVARPFIPPGGAPPRIWEIRGGQATPGLWAPDPFPWVLPFPTPDAWQRIAVQVSGAGLVTAVSAAIGLLEGHGHFGPFAAVLGQRLFSAVQDPSPGSLVLPQDRIIPFLNGGSLLRSSTLGPYNGVVVALGGAPVELVIATDLSLQFLQITDEPSFLFRMREKIALRIKEAGAIVRLQAVQPTPTITSIVPNLGPATGGANIVITGTNLDGATQVHFGLNVATLDGQGQTIRFTADSDTQITLPLPPGNPDAPSDVSDVRVTTPGGTTPSRPFTYHN